MTPDEESAIAICRTTYGPNCLCEKSGRMVCAKVEQEVAVLREYLDMMRAAMRMDDARVIDVAAYK